MTYQAVNGQLFCHFIPFDDSVLRCKERPIELLRNDARREINKAIREDAVRVRGKGFRSMIDVRQDLKLEIINSRTKQCGIAQVKL